MQNVFSNESLECNFGQTAFIKRKFHKLYFENILSLKNISNWIFGKNVEYWLLFNQKKSKIQF